MTPKVSIIVPVYNTQRYLDRCVESLVNQTLKDIEIILVDDGSPDQCPQKCDEWTEKDSRIKVVHKKNGGLGFARNSGLEKATGEYVAFVDSDDYVLLDTYETLYAEAVRGEYDVVYFGNTYHSVDGRKEDHAVLDVICDGRSEVDGYIARMLYEDAADSSCDNHVVASACMEIYKHQIIRDNHLLFESERMILSEDLLFNIDFLVHCNRLRCYPKAFYQYCCNVGSVTQTFKPQKIDSSIRLYEALCRRLDSYGLLSLKPKAMLNFLESSVFMLKSVFNSSNSFKDKKILCLKIFDYAGWNKIYDALKPEKIAYPKRILLYIIKYRMFWLCLAGFGIYYKFIKK